MERRTFVKATMGILGMVFLPRKSRALGRGDRLVDAKKYLKEILYTKEEIDAWFAGEAFPFSKYHARFGWLLNDGCYRDGIDDSISTYTYAGEDGERIMSNYNDKSCRINTYGDSYTQCHQVSDHETWQEVLAAHLQEPVRNLGIGGWSVYQAYLRMLFEEERTPAEYIIFNIYEDDHLRNLDAWRNIRVQKHPQHIESTLPFVKVDLKRGTMQEFGNPRPTRESFYDLCDLEKTYALFKDDFVLKIMLAHRNAEAENPSEAYSDMMTLTRTHGIETRIETGASLSTAADALHRETGLFASRRIVEKAESFAQEKGKKILYVLSYPARYIAAVHAEGSRWDQPFIDFLREKNLTFVDLAETHLEEYKSFRCSIRDYLDRYFIGHYNPMGNMFCAFAMKDKLVDMLAPRPLPYR